jgi:outer membrane protein assembly complex protein YaeT
LKPTIEARIETPGGEEREFTFDARLETPLPRPLEAQRAMFNVKAGERYRFDDVQFTGLHAMDEESAREYFVGEKVLLARGAARLYSPTRLQRGLDGVEGELRRHGYADATVTVETMELNDETGAVDAVIAVNEGVRREVASLRVEVAGQESEIPALNGFVSQPWSQHWQQDVAAAVRNHYYRQGYPDVQVSLRQTTRDEQRGSRLVDVVAHVETGEQVRIGEVRFEGAEQTKEVVLRRRIRNEGGDLLNPLAMDQARFRLARLGVFDAVNLRYEPPDGPVRDAVFALEEGHEMEVNLLFGWGSYEQLRGGVEWRQLNLFGRAHQSRLLLLQSLKSSRGEYSYTVPELFGESLDGTARVFGLQRQEESFLRQEYGGNVSLSAPVQRLGVNATVGYTYEALRSKENELNTSPADDEQVTAASVDVTVVRDRRDNPLRPRSGYRVFARAETASRYFGSGVDYQRAELGGSYHRTLGAGRWLHVGLNHGLITTFGGSNDSQLPVNKRFFPGGDNSIRGYQVGEAAPLGADGRYLGAKSYLLLNLEVEQALTTKWSVVAFVDAIGTTARLAEYPFEEELYSVGLGVRYQTLIGPLRAEYGRNLNPREVDPSGTLLFSIGYPF